MDRVDIDFDKAHELRWTRKAPNGEIMADSSEGYKNVHDCIAAALRVNKGAEFFLYGQPLVNPEQE